MPAATRDDFGPGPGPGPLQPPDPGGSQAAAVAGWHPDPASLRGLVDDRAAVKAQLAAATGQDRVWLPRVLGRVELAATVGERPLDAGPAGRRAFPQIAYAHHWADRFGRVAQVRSEALRPADTAARWATTRRHIHRQRFGQGDDTGAPAEPETALRVRTRAGAARDLSVCSAAAARQARELAGR